MQDLEVIGWSRVVGTAESSVGWETFVPRYLLQSESVKIQASRLFWIKVQRFQHPLGGLTPQHVVSYQP